ncbi:MAG: tetratricopeptide repeat protein [Acidobacteriia bacterium]|nr:tetratricopeptide repeat protein [Terriglobia bacterium]
MKTLLSLHVLAGSFWLCWCTDPGAAQQFYDRTEYRKAIGALQPERSRDVAVLALAAKSYYMLGDFKKASELLERAIVQEPKRSGLHHWLGKSYGRRAETSIFITAGRWASKCRQAFEKAVELDPENVEAMSDLMEYYIEAPGFLGGGMDKASAMAARIGKLDPVEMHYAQARLAEERKDFMTAEKHLRAAADLAPRQMGRILDLAKFLARQGRVQESDAVFQRAARITPEDPKLLFAMAQAYVQNRRNLAEARQLLERFLAAPLTPDDPPRADAERLLRQARGS